ncbi:hypothetical protein Dsin_026251 [Dipteronia sinensis]|uniref:D-isomer specific 2-hydroxyacid dehydrogenase NAD-binding domain-containing protein n=1 Tax=Dipteronia sinensis TaxID=43782 RepID=A0AAE0DXX9_9ROSI|nr:hypothetical protein Dsin_026251 [Dipteronia sinensis]
MMVTTSSGLNHIDMPECRRRGIAVANAGSVPSEDVADLVVGLLIDVLRKVSASDRYVRGGLWTTNGDFTLGSKIKGAGLDVFEKEPDVPKELFELDNVVLSPHCAMWTWEAFDDRPKYVVANLEAFFSNKPLLSPVVDD